MPSHSRVSPIGARSPSLEATPSPVLGCRCSQCDIARVYIHRGLTDGQRATVDTLHFAVPRHETDLFLRDGIRSSSIASLIYPHGDRPALVRMVNLREANLRAPSMRFLLLSQHGEEMRGAVARYGRRAA